jgi:hypothetical protein
LLPVSELFAKQPVENFLYGGAFFFSGLKFSVNNVLHPFKAQINKQLADFFAHQ